MTSRDSANKALPAGNGADHTSAVPSGDRGLSGPELGQMAANASRATDYLKSISHEQRLMILCNLVSGEKSVSELEQALGARQAAVSQQLARLRQEGLVTRRRDGKTIYYSLADERSQRVIGLLYELFCERG